MIGGVFDVCGLCGGFDVVCVDCVVCVGYFVLVFVVWLVVI